jgi:hypothetical protein
MKNEVNWGMIAVYVILGLVILGLLVMTFFPGMIYAFRDSGVLGESRYGNSVEDKCNPPAGSSYTEESWREHMSHHPSIYEDCLT